MSKEAVKLRLADAIRNERHNNVAETRYWLDQYKQIATASVAAQQKPWVELTDEERQEIWKGCDPQHAGYVTALVEAKLREKNGGAAQPAPVQELDRYIAPKLEDLEHEDHCRFWHDGDFCTCGAVNYAELQFWKNKAAAQPAHVQEPDAVVTGYYGGNCVVTPTDPARVFNTGTAFYTQPTDHSEQHLDMVRALDALLVVQDEPCSIDHHGYCQSHYLDNVNSYGGCRVANARALVAKVRGKP